MVANATLVFFQPLVSAERTNERTNESIIQQILLLSLLQAHPLATNALQILQLVGAQLSS